MKIVLHKSLLARITRGALYALAINRAGRPPTSVEFAQRIMSRWRGRSGVLAAELYGARDEQWQHIQRWRACRPYGWDFRPEQGDTDSPGDFTCQQPRICPWCYCRSIARVVSTVLCLPRVLSALDLAPDRFQLLSAVLNVGLSGGLSSAPSALSHVIRHAQSIPGGGWARLFPLPSSPAAEGQRAGLSILLLVPASFSSDPATVAQQLGLPSRLRLKVRTEPLTDPTRIGRQLAAALAYPQVMMSADPAATCDLLRRIASDRARMKLARSFGRFQSAAGLIELAHDVRRRMPRESGAAVVAPADAAAEA